MHPRKFSDYGVPILTVDEVAEFGPPERGSLARFEAVMVKQTLPTGAIVYRGTNSNMVGMGTPRRDHGSIYEVSEWHKQMASAVQEHFSGDELDRAAMMLLGLMRDVGESDAEYRARAAERIRLSAVVPPKRGCPECPAGLGERCGDDCPRVRRYKATRCKAIPVRGSKLTATKGEWKLATGFEGCSIHEDEPHDTHLFAEDFQQWRWGNEPEYVYCAVCECRIRDVGPAGLQCVRLLGSDRLGHVCDTCAKTPAADLEWHGDRLVPKTKREPVVVWSYLGVTSKVGWRDGGERFPTEFYVEFADAPSMACPDCGAAPNAREGCPGCRPPGCEKCVTPHEEGGHYCSPECVRQATEVLRGKHERRTVPLAALTRALRAALPVIAPTWDACDRKPLQAAAHEVCEIGEAAGDVGGVPLQPMLVGMLGIIAAAPHLAPKVATEQANKVLGEMRRAFPRKRT